MRWHIKGRFITAVGGLFACSVFLAQCAPRGKQLPVRQAERPVVKRTPPAHLQKPTPRPQISCPALLTRYQHRAAHLPYPANVPYRTLLVTAGMIVKAHAHPAKNARCVVLLQKTMSPLFGPELPSGVHPRLNPTVATKRPE